MKHQVNIKNLNCKNLCFRLTAVCVFLFMYQLSYPRTFKVYNNDSLFSYFVILGSFSINDNAVFFKNILEDEGFDPFILISENLLNRVVVDSFARLADAQERILQIKRTYAGHQDAWVLFRDTVSTADSPAGIYQGDNVSTTESTAGIDQDDKVSAANSLAVLYQEIYTGVLYRQIIHKAERAANHQKYDEAIGFFQQAIEIKPDENLPYRRIAEIEPKSGKSKGIFFLYNVNFKQHSLLIQSLIIVTIYSILSMIILLVIILFHRNQMERKEKLRQGLKEKYQTLLMDYLFNEDEFTDVPVRINKIAADNFKRIILVEEIKDLIVNLSGDAAENLRGLYYRLNLDVDSRFKALTRKWHIKIKGFRELAFMNIKDANQEITRCLDSNNDLLRMESQLALVRLNDNDRFSFLDHLQRPFTKWEQMNVHEMIVSHNLEIPDFRRWLFSDNRTVVLFSLKMIKVFKQRDSWEDIVRLLDNEDPEIRKTAIFVLGELRIKQSVMPLKHHYKSEIYENLLEIVTALGKISDMSTLKFLIMVIDKENDVQLQIEAAKAIRDMGDPGEQALEKLMHSDYKNYKIIIKHVLDKRI